MHTYERVFNALGDPTRRAILDRLRRGPRPVGAIAQHLPVSRPAVSQHLKILKGAGLVSDKRDGTRRVYQLSTNGLMDVRAYFDAYWSAALQNLKTVAESDHRNRRRI